MRYSRIVSILILSFFVAALLAVSADHADAKRRFGGGSSFGSKSLFKKNYAKPLPKQGVTNKNQNNFRNTQSPRRGLFGGMGGIFGGLLAGSLLGSLLFGGGFGGFGMFDLLLVFGLIFLVSRFFGARRRSMSQEDHSAFAQQGYRQAEQNNQQPQSTQQYEDTHYRRAEGAWDHLRSEPESGPATPYSEEAGPTIPAGFDEEEFLKGAKMVFTRLQHSWDARDLDDIRHFTTDDVFAEITQQATGDPTPSQTEILLINARTLELKEEETDMRVAVYFDVLMREDKAQAQPEQVREVWHFLRRGDEQSMWLLDGIQQLEQ